jgi:hypothetical protein
MNCVSGFYQRDKRRRRGRRKAIVYMGRGGWENKLGEETTKRKSIVSRKCVNSGTVYGKEETGGLGAKVERK